MSNEEKFNAFKQKLIDNNEEQYGAETRRKYGAESIAQSNRRIAGMGEEQYAASEMDRVQIDRLLTDAIQSGDPAGEAAQNACAVHKRWLCCFAPDHYCADYHAGLAEMYLADERFRAYYERIAPGCAQFFHDAILIYVG